MAGGAVALSAGMIRVDRLLTTEAVRELGWLYAFGPEGARAVLAAIASSMITVAGLTFSITMLTLQLASSQFGHRILRNFMRDRGNQVVLGTFIATFVYCLLILRTVQGAEGASFVPHLSVATGVLLAMVSLGILIFFIHHTANAIRIETILEQLTKEARSTIDHLYPEQLGRDSTTSEAENRCDGTFPPFGDACLTVRSECSGYVQRIDEQAIMQIATKCDLLLRIDARPGRFVVQSDALLTVYPADRVDDRINHQLCSAFVVGQERTPSQDLDFAVHRIVEIAQRAMSPGINDPTTAIYCLDRLRELLTQLARRRIPGSHRFDETGRLRVVTEAVSFEQIASRMFRAIARYSISDSEVIGALIRVIGEVALHTPAEARARLTALSDAVASEHRMCSILSSEDIAPRFER